MRNHKPIQRNILNPSARTKFALSWRPFLVIGVIFLITPSVKAEAENTCPGLFAVSHSPRPLVQDNTDHLALRDPQKQRLATDYRKLIHETALMIQQGFSPFDIWARVRMSPYGQAKGWRSLTDFAKVLEKAEIQSGRTLQPLPASAPLRFSIPIAPEWARALQPELELLQAWLQMRMKIGSERLAKLTKFERSLGPSVTTALPKERRDAFYLETLQRPNDQEPDLLFTWRVNRPEDPVLADDGTMYLRPLKKNTIDYVASPFEPEAPFHGVYRMMGMPIPSAGFYKNVYRNYEGRIRDALIELVQRVEDRLPTKRQSYGSVVDPVTQESIGTLRVSDGTALRPDDPFMPFDFEREMDMPFEAIFKERGVPFHYAKELQEIRRTNPYQHLFEIGKFSLEESAAPATRNRARKALEFFMLDYYVKRYPDAIFHAHVATEQHLRLYESRYGFTIKEKIEIPNPDDAENPRVEYILTQTAEGFGKKLRARLGLK